MILVVGGAGFVGSHVVKALRQANLTHLVLDNLERGHRTAVQDSPLFVGDIRQPEDLRRVFELHEIHLVMHFAAYIEVGESVKEPQKFFENNVKGTQNLLVSAIEAGVDKFVFSSTAGVYGNTSLPILTEDARPQPASPYAETKLLVEEALRKHDEAGELRYMALRYFNAAGADSEGVLGEDHRPESHLIPIAIDAALGRRDPVTICGTDYPTPDGTCIRDYIHVEDLASAHLKAAHHLLQGGESATLNLGIGSGYSVMEVLDAVDAVHGMPSPRQIGVRREGDPPRLVADSSRAKNLLQWSPDHTDIQGIVRDAYNWRKAHPTGYPD